MRGVIDSKGVINDYADKGRLSRGISRGGAIKTVDMVLTDLPYGQFPLINDIIRATRAKCRGTSIYFMYPEDVQQLEATPDRVCHWIKTPSSKNTSKTYSRFIEAIVIYDISDGVFNQDMHWSNRTGIFTDQLMTKPIHPHEKPASLIERLILNHSKVLDTILDACMGSGTTPLAAHRLDRDSYGIEIEDMYYRLALSRFAKAGLQ